MESKLSSFLSVESTRLFEVGGDNNMNNPWKEINLSDYENHMALDSVQQSQAMNQMMKGLEE